MCQRKPINYDIGRSLQPNRMTSSDHIYLLSTTQVNVFALLETHQNFILSVHVKLTSSFVNKKVKVFYETLFSYNLCTFYIKNDKKSARYNLSTSL